MQGFDTALSGNYIPLDDVIDKGIKEFSEKYKVTYDKILLLKKDTGIQLEMNGKEIDYNDVRDILGIKKDSGKTELNPRDCDSVFRSISLFNELISVKISSAIDKKGAAKTIVGMIKISYDRVFFIAVDSLGNNLRDTLLSLNPQILLTKYLGKYFLNFKTPFGWEIVQIDAWENKFLSIRPFYFTGYNDCSKNLAELIASTKNIYPNLVPILSSEKKIIGFKAELNPKLLLEKFSVSETAMLMTRIK